MGLRRELGELGFDVVRFARVDPDGAPGADAFAQWLDGGNHAEMAWLERSLPKRRDPQKVLPGARSMVLLGVNYHPTTATPLEPRWARYALYRDYHDTIKPALGAAGRILEKRLGVTSHQYRYYVDTGPVLERNWAAVGGVGFRGKNCMLISRDYGNWLFLAVILVAADLAADPPVSRRHASHPVGSLCGNCTACLDACPTRALPAPGVLDARRCISYLTIEHRGIIPVELRAAIGRHIYGCDICAEVCPWNRFAQQARSVLLDPRPEIARLTGRELLELTPEKFAAVFRGTVVKRLKLRGLLRNACIVAANTKDRSCLPRLLALAADHPESLVRAHAVWAIRVLEPDRSLGEMRAAEDEAEVLAEYDRDDLTPRMPAA